LAAKKQNCGILADIRLDFAQSALYPRRPERNKNMLKIALFVSICLLTATLGLTQSTARLSEMRTSKGPSIYGSYLNHYLTATKSLAFSSK